MPSPPASAPSWLRRLIGYCLRHRFDLFGAFGAAVAGALVSVSVPLVIKHVIDIVSQPVPPGGSRPSVAPWVALLVAAALLQYGLTFGRRFT
ncbi:MAG: ATP-binding cassette, subfamily bacterial, partial [Pseudonocardiales bacterium]|nr:ATP-binding cassette, subfamily bacterial [Pseudonocardiales bacterium]